MELKIYRGLTITSALLAPLAIFLSLPPFHFGIWVQVELGVAYIHFVSSLGLMGLAGLMSKDDVIAQYAVRNPLVLLATGLAAISLFMSLFATMPWISVNGAPEHGVGAVSFLNIAALTAVYLFIFNTVKWRQLIVIESLLIIAVIFILDGFFRKDFTFAPFYFGDYLAYYAIFGFVLIFFTLEKSWKLLLFSVPLFAWLLVLTGNKAAILAAVLSAVLTTAFYSFRINKKAIVVTCTIIFPVVIGILIIGVGPQFEEAYRSSIRQFFSSSNLSDLVVRTWGSLWSRAMLDLVVIWQIASDPIILLKGLGWGHFNEALLQNLTGVEGRLQELIGPSRIYWDAIRRNDFHSHNQYLETLLSTGVIGLLAYFAYMAAIPYYAIKSNFWIAVYLALFLAVLNSFWFQMPQSHPMMAMSFALLVGSNQQIAPVANHNLKEMSALLMAATLMLVMAGLSFSDSKSANDRLKAINTKPTDATGISIKSHKNNALVDVYQSALLQKIFSLVIESRGNKDKLGKIYVGRLKSELAPFVDDDLPISSTSLAITLNNVVSGIYFQIPDKRAEFSNAISKWPLFAEELIRRAPKRSDILVPYLNYLLLSKNEQKILNLTNTILENFIQDPVALWFSGMVYLNLPGQKEIGINRLRLSLKNGIRNLMPVPDQMIKMLEE